MIYTVTRSWAKLDTNNFPNQDTTCDASAALARCNVRFISILFETGSQVCQKVYDILALSNFI